MKCVTLGDIDTAETAKVKHGNRVMSTWRQRHTVAVAVSLDLSDTFVRLPRLVALSLGTRRWNCWITWNRWITSSRWVAGEKFQNSVVRGGSDKHRLYPVLYDMSWKDYKNEKMKLNAREKIDLKLFSTRQILPRESTFLCVNWIGFSLVSVESLWG